MNCIVRQLEDEKRQRELARDFLIGSGTLKHYGIAHKREAAPIIRAGGKDRVKWYVYQ